MVVYSPYPHAETRVQRQAELLVKEGVEVDVICPSLEQDPEQECHNGVRIFRPRKRWIRKRGTLAQFSQYIIFFILATIKLIQLNRRSRYDVIQIHNIPDFLVFVALIPKLMGARVILDLHDLTPELYRSRIHGFTGRFLIPLIDIQERLSCKFADHVITVTERWRRFLIQRGVPPEKCSVVMNVADTQVFHPLDFNKKPQAENGGFHLFYHGSTSRLYRLDLVLMALDRLRQQIPGIHMTIVGGGESLELLKSLSKDLDLEERVKFISWVSVEELPALISKADLGVVPLRKDGFTDTALPTKLMEYAAVGLPSITSRTPINSDYFDDSMVQFCASDDLDDLIRCIVLLYSDPERREQLAQGIQKFHQLHSWTKVGAEYVTTVERLISK